MVKNNLLKEIANKKGFPTFHVDNMSAMQLEKNPAFTEGQSILMLNTRFFFIRKSLFYLSLNFLNISLN